MKVIPSIIIIYDQYLINNQKSEEILFILKFIHNIFEIFRVKKTVFLVYTPQVCD